MALMQLELWEPETRPGPPAGNPLGRPPARADRPGRPGAAGSGERDSVRSARPGALDRAEGNSPRTAAAAAPPATLSPPASAVPPPAPAATPACRSQLLDSLRSQVSRLETGGRDRQEEPISCGSPVLDAMLPGGGLAPGTVNEWVAHSEGCGAGWLALLAARGALARSAGRGRLVVIDGGGFYPPAAMAAGIPAESMIVVRPSGRRDFIWAADQALRSPAVAVVWGFLDRIDDRDARRLQLAAETGRCSAMFVRPRQALREASWAEVRWHVRGLASAGEPQWEARAAGERRLEARLVRCRGGRAGKSVRLQIDSAGRLHHEPSSPSRQTAALPLVAQLAHPAAADRYRRRRA